ncbi:gag-protease polyprotein [Cucumis melo var. makuwa]|uniref:Gag-protease polyprotein n=1 Tax=Cucumis melo var. makuwa TaxID=1194695 RepID=A0A5D3E3E9_CUCMM|nr:gag-protease polyprotein [Cucumis melo var. makuwa]
MNAVIKCPFNWIRPDLAPHNILKLEVEAAGYDEEGYCGGLLPLSVYNLVHLVTPRFFLSLHQSSPSFLTAPAPPPPSSSSSALQRFSPVHGQLPTGPPKSIIKPCAADTLTLSLHLCHLRCSPSSSRVLEQVVVEEVTLEFRNFTASTVEANSPLLGWIRLDADLNEILATSQVRVWRGADRRGARRMREGHMDASGFLYASTDGNDAKESYSCEPRCYGVEVQRFDYADAGAAAACPTSFCFGSSCTLGRAGSVVARGQALEGFQKVKPHDIRWVFGGPHQGSDVVIFFRDHLSTTERMLEGDVGQITWEQFMESFYAKFFFASLRDAKRQEFLNLEQDDRTMEQYDAKFDMLSRFAPEMIATEAARADNLQKRANSFKLACKGSTSGQKRKAEQQPISVPQRNFRSGDEFRRFQQKPFEVGEAARGKPLCTNCGKHHLGRYLFGTRTCFKCRQNGHTTDRCLMRLTGSAQNQGAGAPHQGKVFATNKTEAERAGTV